MADFHVVVIFFVLTGLLLLGTGLLLFKPSKKQAEEKKNSEDLPEQKKKISKLCLAGLIISASYPLVLALDYFGPWNNFYSWDRVWWNRVEFLMPVIGIILSIAGLVKTRKKDIAGRKFALAGLVLPFGYLSIFMLIIFASVIGLIVSNSTKYGAYENSEISDMGNVGSTVNWEYDVSMYRIPAGFDTGVFKDKKTSEAELHTYAESKLQTIEYVNDKSAKGQFQGCPFIIVRSDCLNKWLKANKLGGFSYTTREEYATLNYEVPWEFAASYVNALAVYKDPSDEYIIITNCGDYKVIAEFFEGIGNPVPTELPIDLRETNETKDPVTLKNMGLVNNLNKSINKDLPLSEIIYAFAKMCDEPLDDSTVIFRYGIDYFDGRDNLFSDYDNTTAPRVRGEQLFGFCMARQYKAEDGKYYQIRVEVMYGLNVISRNYKLTQITDKDVDGDFFDYMRNSEAYKYAETAEIKSVNIYVVGQP